jgi:hypothetical protein
MQTVPAILLVACAFLTPHLVRADSPEAVGNDVVAQLDTVADVILSVKDKATAEKAVENLLGITDELKKLTPRAKAVGQPTAAQKKKW